MTTASLPKSPAIFDFMQAVSDDQDLTPDHLPELDLYMDQVICLFQQSCLAEGALALPEATEGKNRGVAGSKKGKEAKSLTKTMINNYSKEGLLLPIKGKKYSPAHILQMQLIQNLKQTLPLGEIKTLLHSMNESLVLDPAQEYDQQKVVGLNQNFLSLKATLRQNLPQALQGLNDLCQKELSQKQDTTPENQEALDVLFLAMVSFYANRAALAAISNMKE